MTSQPIAAIPVTGTPKMQISSSSSVIGGSPRPETRGATPLGEVFGEIDTLSDGRPDRSDH